MWSSCIKMIQLQQIPLSDRFETYFSLYIPWNLQVLFQHASFFLIRAILTNAVLLLYACRPLQQQKRVTRFLVLMIIQIHRYLLSWLLISTSKHFSLSEVRTVFAIKDRHLQLSIICLTKPVTKGFCSQHHRIFMCLFNDCLSISTCQAKKALLLTSWECSQSL